VEIKTRGVPYLMTKFYSGFLTFILVAIMGLIGGPDVRPSKSNKVIHQKQQIVDHDTLWQPFDTALSKAKTDHKMVLVDFYADWCTYCKKMDRNVYPKKEVREALNKYFHPVRINTESNQKITFDGKTYTKKSLSNAFGIKKLPTIIFINSNGKPIAQQPGYMPPDIFTKLLDFVGSGAYKNTSFNKYKVNKTS